METHKTQAYADNYDPEAERERGPDGTLVEFQNESGTKELWLALEEMEDYERTEDDSIDCADVLSDEQFDKLLTYVQENYTVSERGA